MSKKLFHITFTVDAVVAADDLDEAYDIARSDEFDILTQDDACLSVDPAPIEDHGALPDGWDGECLPFGGDGETRITSYLSREDV